MQAIKCGTILFRSTQTAFYKINSFSHNCIQQENFAKRGSTTDAVNSVLAQFNLNRGRKRHPILVDHGLYMTSTIKDLVKVLVMDKYRIGAPFLEGFQLYAEKVIPFHSTLEVVYIDQARKVTVMFNFPLISLKIQAYEHHIFGYS